MSPQAKVFYGATGFGAPQFSADILWRTKFIVSDPVVLVDAGNAAYLFVSALEFGRAQKEATGTNIVLLAPGKKLLPQVTEFLEQEKIADVVVSDTLPYAIGKHLEEHFRIERVQGSLYPERSRKTAEEVQKIEAAQQAAAQAITKTRDFLAKCRVKGEGVYAGGEAVTSEALRKLINSELFAGGYAGIDTIAASGAQAADPHAVGTGPIRAGEPIVLDVFPVSLSTHYYGDMTRTLFKGEPSDDMKKMYEAVRKAQGEALAEVRAGVAASSLHRTAERVLQGEGYNTTMTERETSGFIHGLGHGVGLEVHEEFLRVNSRSDNVLQIGNVFTIEPGLYYPKPKKGISAGGIRIEDIVSLEAEGPRVLADLPKDLGWAIVE